MEGHGGAMQRLAARLLPAAARSGSRPQWVRALPLVGAGGVLALAPPRRPCCCAPRVTPERRAELERQGAALLAAAERDDAEALCELGLLLLSRAVRKREQAAAFGYLQRAAAQRHPRALWALGSCHQLGIGTAKDAAEAVRCFAQAADLGVTEAQYRLGAILATGEGSASQDIPRALACWEAAAAAGYPQAMLALGQHYAAAARARPGAGAANRDVAMVWLRRAAGSREPRVAEAARQAIEQLQHTE